MASRSKEVGRIQFTCTLPLKTGLKVYEFSEKMDVGANKILQELFAYAVEHVHCKRVVKNTFALVFDNPTSNSNNDEDIVNDRDKEED